MIPKKNDKDNAIIPVSIFVPIFTGELSSAAQNIKAVKSIKPIKSQKKSFVVKRVFGLVLSITFVASENVHFGISFFREHMYLVCATFKIKIILFNGRCPCKQSITLQTTRVNNQF
jgi:hypothetical protein